MYHIYTTTGFVIDTHPRGEADRLVSIVTRDLGLVRAIATGARYEKSKLRGHISPYLVGEFSFVKGRELWRLVGAEEGIGRKVSSNDKLKSRESNQSQKKLILAKISSLLKRLIHGEEVNQKLFEHIISAIDFLDSRERLDVKELDALESLIIFRILNALGYIGLDEKFNNFLNSFDIDDQILKEVYMKRGIINRQINTSLRESHL